MFNNTQKMCIEDSLMSYPDFHYPKVKIVGRWNW